ncbi:MAG TPA: aquaporin [Gaiellaceae bacterium]|nr:aquaporin [Gaiellaceae bacterium]
MEGDYLRRGVAEFLGAFALTFFGAGAVMVGAGGLVGVALAYGLVYALMVTAFGHISGGHFNPATTLGFLVTRRIAAALAVVYWLMQLAGACVAALLLWWIFPAEAISPARLGAPLLHPSIGSGAGFALEGIMTAFLVLAVFATAVDERGAFRAVAGFGIGLVITIGALCGGPLTGAAMNPARAFGPEVVYDVWESYTWIYYAGPAVGAIFAAVLYELLYLRPWPRPTPGGPAGTGVEEPGAGDLAAS